MRAAGVIVAVPVQGPSLENGRFFGETRRTCAWCEYFDCGGERRSNEARLGVPGLVLAGDCLNNLSPRFTTDSNETCDAFVPGDSRA